jgi:hypothetical protein
MLTKWFQPTRHQGNDISAPWCREALLCIALRDAENAPVHGLASRLKRRLVAKAAGYDPEISEWDNPRRDYLPSCSEFIAAGSQPSGSVGLWHEADVLPSCLPKAARLDAD